jgi:cytochrome c551/c552
MSNQPANDPSKILVLNSIAMGIMGCAMFAFMGIWWITREDRAEIVVVPTATPTDEEVVILSTSTATVQERLQSLPQGNAVEGEPIFSDTGCSACHSLDDSIIVGPPLNGIEQRIPNGYESVEAYLIEAIIDPGFYVVEGYPNAMPQHYNQSLDSSQLADLVAFILEQ